MLRTLTLLCGIATSAAAADFFGAVVSDHDRTPVVAAAVTLRQGTNVLAEMETDDKGQFRAANVPSGAYTVDVKKSSYTTLERKVTVSAADLNLTLRLVRQGVITGMVKDTEGRGVRNALVAAVPAPADGGRPIPGRAAGIGAITDSRGVFRIHSLPPGSYIVAMALGQPRDMLASVRGMLPDTSLGNAVQLYPTSSRPDMFTVRSGEEYNNLNFAVYKGPLFTIRGTVSGPSGASFRVVLQNADARSVPLATASVVPGKGFEFTRVPPGSYRIVAASQQSYIVELPPNFNIPANAQGITIVEIRPGVRAAILTGDTPPNVPAEEGFRVSLATDQAVQPSFGETLLNVATQDVSDIVVPSFRGTIPKLVYQPAAGCEQNGTLLLNPIEDWGTGTINRQVTPGKEIAALPALPPSPYAMTLTGPAGRNCFVQQTEIDFRQASADVALPVIAVPFGSIKGKLKTAGSVEDFEVALLPPNGAPAQWFRPDADALFSFAQLRSGRYRVSVHRSTGDRTSPVATQEIEVASGSQIEIEFPELK